MSSAYLLLEDGTRFDGEAVGADGSVTGEVVFTTGMSGYQESMTDPSFARQLITFTTAHVGNYGVSEAAMESDRIHAAGAIMRSAVDYDDAPSAEKIPPRIAPAERMWRTSARVSTPAMPGMPCARSQLSQPCSAPGASS